MLIHTKFLLSLYYFLFRGFGRADPARTAIIGFYLID